MAQLEVSSSFQADVQSLLGLVVALFIGAVATAAGVGGGAIYIPLFNVLIGFALKPSTALSQACITAGSLAAVAINLHRTHPDLSGAPLIDFPLMLLLTPLLLVGVGIGVLLNVTLPSWLLNILLLVLLVLLLVQAVAKGRALWQQETKRAQAAAKAAACQYTESNTGTSYSPGVTGVGSSGVRQSLLAPDRRAFSSHSSSNAATAVPPSPGLRLRRGQVYNGPRGPRGLEPEQEASLSCLEGVQPDGTAVVWSETVPTTTGDGGGVRRRGVDVSWDCMEGVTSGDVTTCDTPPSSSSQLPSNEFFAMDARPASPGDWGVKSGTKANAMALQSLQASGRHAPASPGMLSPVSSLKYAPSWRAFNELGAMNFETDLEGASADEEVGSGGGPGHRRTSHLLASPSSSPVAMPPSARLLSQLLRRPLALQLHMPPSSSRNSSVELRRRTVTRRSSFDPSMAADAIAAAASAGAMAAADEEAGQPANTWLQRRSKWRKHFPASALLNNGASKPTMVERSPHPLSPFARDQQQQLLTDCPKSISSSTSLLHNGSGLPRLRTRLPRSKTGDSGADGDGGGDGAELGEPLLGAQTDSQDEPHVAAADPRADPSGMLPLAGGSRGGADTPSGPGCFTAVSDGYRPPIRLATLHEEFDDRGEVRSSDDCAPGTSLGEGPSGGGGGPMMPKGTVTVRLRSPFAEAAITTPDTSPLPIMSVSRLPIKSEPVRHVPVESANLYDSLYDVERPCAVVEIEPEVARPVGYFHIELGPADNDAADVVGRETKPLARLFTAVARKWIEPWKAALRRIPLHFAGGLILAWVVYLALQVARAFQPLCSPAWWTLLAVQIVAMMGISAAALLAAAAVLSRRETEGEANAREGGEDGTAALPPSPPLDTRVAAEQEPALNSTAALLVLQAPLSTLCATFGAGLTGGMLGLGGGMVMGPLLLQIGVHPQVTAASSGAMVLFSSSAALVQFALLHRLNWPYAAIFGTASLLVGLMGTQVVARAIKRSGRPSLVVLALAGVMAVGAVCVATFGLRQAAAQLRSGALGFVGMCSTVSGK